MFYQLGKYKFNVTLVKWTLNQINAAGLFVSSSKTILRLNIGIITTLKKAWYQRNDVACLLTFLNYEKPNFIKMFINKNRHRTALNDSACSRHLKRCSRNESLN